MRRKTKTIRTVQPMKVDKGSKVTVAQVVGDKVGHQKPEISKPTIPGGPQIVHKRFMNMRAAEQTKGQMLIEDAIAKTSERVTELRKLRKDEVRAIKRSRYRRFINGISI